MIIFEINVFKVISLEDDVPIVEYGIVFGVVDAIVVEDNVEDEVVIAAAIEVVGVIIVLIFSAVVDEGSMVAVITEKIVIFYTCNM